jgi:glycosyltransferase involved in cell wall biosynthesis
MKQGLAEVTVTTIFAKEQVDWADVIVMQRVTGDVSLHVAKYCRLAGKKVIYELDDNVFNYPDSPEYKKDNVQQETVSVIKVLRQCDAMTTTTQAIAEAVNELVDIKVYVLPNQIDFGNFPDLKVEKKNSLIIGWAGGHFHVQDLSLIEEPLCRILDEYPEVMVAMLGCCPKVLYERYKGRIWVEPFSTVQDFFTKMALMRFDIGLAPLYKTEFARSRSNLRLLQYSALSIPAIGSEFGEYGTALNNGLKGILAEDTEWFEKISHLIENEQERKRLGEEAFDYVKEHYDIEKNVHRWAECYAEI